MAISPDGTYIACGSDSHSNIQLWNIKAAQATLKPLKTDFIRSLSFSPDGKYLVSLVSITIELWNIETGEKVREFTGQLGIVGPVKFSPDGEYVIAGSTDSTVQIWNVQTGEAALSFEGHTFWVTSTSFSPDGKYIVSGSGDHTIRVWRFETNKVGLRPIEWHTEMITHISFSFDGNYIASVSQDDTIQIWNIETGKLALKLESSTQSEVGSISFSPNGEYIASGSWDSMTRLWNTKTGELEVEYAPFGEDIGKVSVVFSPDGRHIISGSGSNSLASECAVHLRNIKSGDTTLLSFGQSTIPRPHHIRVFFSPNGKYIAVASRTQDSGTIRLWNIETGELAFKPYKDEVSSRITFSADGEIVACSSDHEIWVWKSETGEAVCEPFSQEYFIRVNDIAMSPDGKNILIADLFRNTGTHGPFRICQIFTGSDIHRLCLTGLAQPYNLNLQ